MSVQAETWKAHLDVRADTGQPRNAGRRAAEEGDGGGSVGIGLPRLRERLGGGWTEQTHCLCSSFPRFLPSPGDSVSLDFGEWGNFADL